MSEPTVVFESVWKKFRKGERHDSLRDLIPSLVRRAARGQAPVDLSDEQEFWALRDVSFEVNAGEALGIIGPNGAGKSTTLKLLTKILKPSRGRAHVRGRVGALIEVAAGFHPDLTGRENIFLQGAIMGMKRVEVTRKLDEIVEFAGVSDFIDTPVKRYSSGMNARLGFAIAAHLEPDVLIIDEVLSVGDMAFQRRCVDRMEEFRRSGIAIVFVSHDMSAVSRLCHNAVLLNHKIVAAGPTPQVVSEYANTGAVAETPPDAEVIIESARLLEHGNQATSIAPGAHLTLTLCCRSRQPVSDLTFGVALHRASDQLVVYHGHFMSGDLDVDRLPASTGFDVRFDFRAHLLRGQYYFECYVFHNPTGRFLSRVGPVGTLTVVEASSRAGVTDLEVVATAGHSSLSVATTESATRSSVRVISVPQQV